MKKDTKNTTQQIALDFVKNTVASIEKELKFQCERHGYYLESFQDGINKLDRIVSTAESDPRFKVETFSVNGRAIMAVRWSPKGFGIEIHSDKVANAIKHNPLFGIKKGDLKGHDLILSASKEQVEIEVRAAAYMEKYRKDLAAMHRN